MKYLLVAPMFGMWGWLASMAVLEKTGSDAVAGLCFGLVVAVMHWGFNQRGKFDGFDKNF